MVSFDIIYELWIFGLETTWIGKIMSSCSTHCYRVQSEKTNFEVILFYYCYMPNQGFEQELGSAA